MQFKSTKLPAAWRAVLALGVVVAFAMACASVADESEAEDSYRTWYYDGLDEFSKILYDESVRMSGDTLTTTFEHDSSMFSGEEGLELLKGYMMNAYISLKCEWIGMYVTQGPMDLNVDDETFTISYAHTGLFASASAAHRDMESALGSIEIDDSSRYSAVVSIHDYVCNLLTYSERTVTEADYSLYNALLGDHMVVCEGYAKLFKALCDLHDVPCVIVTGNALGNNGALTNHMYDYVMMDDGAWYLVDATWDDQDSGISRTYLLAGSDSEGFFKPVRDTHFPNTGALAPPALSRTAYVPSEVFFSYDSASSTLRFYGTREIPDTDGDSNWAAFKKTAKAIVVSDGIVSIGKRAFYGFSKVASVYIGKDVEIIGERAFTRCSSLESLTIPGNVASVGKFAFYGCNKMSDLVTKDGLESIGYRAFYGCAGLRSVTVASTVASIGSGAFGGCSFYDADGATPLSPVPADIAGYKFKGENGALVLSTKFVDGFKFSKDGLRYQVTSCLSKDRQVALIGHADGISSLVVPGSVSTSAGYIPVTSIGSKAFYGCGSLTSADLGEVRSVGYKAFARCTSLSSLALPEGLSSISSYAFYGCSELAALVIPGDEVDVGTSAFSACTGLKSVVFAGTGASIGTNAFYRCTGMETLDLGGVCSVGYKAFPYCNGMKSLTIPGSVESIGAYAFYSCAGLESLTVQDGVMEIGKSAFSECASLGSVDIGGSVASIGANAFYKHSFYAPDGKTKLAANAESLSGHAFAGTGTKLIMTE